MNYLGGDEGVEGLEAAYGRKLARLAVIKGKFDPANLFRLNQNIAPALVQGKEATALVERFGSLARGTADFRSEGACLRSSVTAPAISGAVALLA